MNRHLLYLNLSWNNLLTASPDQAEQDYLVLSLSRFIKYNKHLLHIDLSYTSLTEYVLHNIGSCLRRTKSILAVHFSGNPGVTQELKDYLFQRLHCRHETGLHDLPATQTFHYQATHHGNSPRN